ncbi:hypothetical protein [Pseudonocardia abyssalis]|uniref:Uncharacterized protein n=1 Tax=Pseudonocardia abyssalis TaxID=2792008 RepID=A0ABS6V222_9PSEU|nr:hypothetical protein [Pseudonocardia abyssalis]MBW0114165.1 hypothetical protein [Pseudonocardia abyssalis]MBW0138558.1 hypothetical protein [Pseudonocardia abyssalis]
MRTTCARSSLPWTVRLGLRVRVLHDPRDPRRASLPGGPAGRVAAGPVVVGVAFVVAGLMARSLPAALG